MYANPKDIAYAEALGVSPGRDIFIHGMPPEKLRSKDRTADCIAVTNDAVVEIYAMVRDSTPIFINP